MPHIPFASLRIFGAMYKHKLGNPRARDAVDFLSSVMRPTDMGRDKYFFAQCALRRVSSFSEQARPMTSSQTIRATQAWPVLAGRFSTHPRSQGLPSIFGMQ